METVVLTSIISNLNRSMAETFFSVAEKLSLEELLKIPVISEEDLKTAEKYGNVTTVCPDNKLICFTLYSICGNVFRKAI